jgi:hypothetical protein
MAGAVILPGVYGGALLYRNPHPTNVHVHQYYVGYDYANPGLKSPQPGIAQHPGAQARTRRVKPAR